MERSYTGKQKSRGRPVSYTHLNSIGAITIAMTGNMDTGMAKVGQYVVTYSNGDDQVYSDSNQANSLRIGFELLHQFEGWDKYDKAMEAYKYICLLYTSYQPRLPGDHGCGSSDLRRGAGGESDPGPDLCGPGSADQV